MRLFVMGGVLCALSCAAVPRAPATHDTDKDGVVDVKDECPDEAGETGGDGCPELPRIALESGRIVIRGKIVFELNSAELLPRNAKLLDALARLMNESAQVKRVEVQGHTDDTGEDDFNLALSLKRAEKVRQALIERGVDANRLSVRGLGKSEPVATNETPEGRARNRRVELKVLE
ncbi:MAG: OmpA family protein [Myxococcota bacterium]|jgi:outer membrane protein OmpA-like peptidoglycan-associated protein